MTAKRVTKLISVQTRLEPDINARLDAVCVEEDRSKAWMVHQAIVELLEKLEAR